METTERRIAKVGKIVLVCAVFAWSAYLLAQKIDLTTADLGRHLKNGELIVRGDAETRRAVLSENFYSYTEPQEPFLNHHWGAGVVFYAVQKMAGFSGLHLFFLALMLLALFFAFDTARRAYLQAGRASGHMAASALLLFVLPLVAVRSEVRPEVFSYLFSAFFVWLLYRYEQKEVPSQALFALPLVQVVWVNIHIGFVFGPIIVGAFWLAGVLKKQFSRALFFTLCGTVFASLVNPAGLRGVLYPLHIFKGYGYRVLENQSIPFLEHLGLHTGYDFLLFKITALLALAGALFFFYRRRSTFPVPFFLLTLAVGALAALGVRHFPSFALMALPFLAACCSLAFHEAGEKKKIWLTVFLVVLGIFGIFRGAHLAGRRSSSGIGLLEGNLAAGEFVRAAFADGQMAGPIFNNYDIGGYLIYFLAPAQKVFTDNRPEAYPADFFNAYYIPAQENQESFDALDAQYHFGAIVFQYHDATPWAQTFLARIVHDARFTQVFADDKVIILIRKSGAEHLLQMSG